jgi:hypothetical protein
MLTVSMPKFEPWTFQIRSWALDGHVQYREYRFVTWRSAVIAKNHVSSSSLGPPDSRNALCSYLVFSTSSIVRRRMANTNMGAPKDRTASFWKSALICAGRARTRHQQTLARERHGTHWLPIGPALCSVRALMNIFGIECSVGRRSILNCAFHLPVLVHCLYT